MSPQGPARETLIGRDAEIGAFLSFLTADEPSARGWILAGEPGIGKTALWESALDRAASHAAWTLVARAVESEQQLAFAGLADLLSPAIDRVREELPGPQRRALEIALLLSDPDDGPADPRAIGSAVRSCLGVLAEAGPVVVGIDDLQWLDRSTAGALAFALRRAQHLPIRLLATVRALPGSGPATFEEAILQAMAPGSVSQVLLTGISLGALGHLLRERLHVPVGRLALRHLHEASAGNPFLALEMGRASIERSGGLSSIEQPILRRDLLDLVADRIGRLPRATQRALTLVSALAQPTLSGIESAVAAGALEPAVEAGVVSIVGDRINFTHPLYSAAAYDGAGPHARAATHRMLARRVSDPIEAARHEALSARRPSDRAAAIIERGSRVAGERGAPELGAELLVHARRLTPESRRDDQVRRTITEATLRWNVGQADAVERLLAAVLPEIPAGHQRAEARLLQAVVVEWSSGHEPAERILQEALRDRPMAADMEASLRLRLATTAQRSITIARQAGLAAARLAGSGDASSDLMACALLIRAEACLHLGHGARSDDVQRAARLVDAHQGEPDGSPVFPAREIARERLVILACLRDELDEAREGMVAIDANLEAMGWDRSRAIHLAELSIVESWLGHLDTASRMAALSMQLASDSGATGYARGEALLATALAAAWRGDAEVARRSSSDALEIWPAERDPIQAARVLAVRGQLELLDGRPPEAMAALDAVARIVHEKKDREPAHLRHEGDHIEAALATGQPALARGIVADLVERHRVAARPWLAVMSGRGRAHLAAALGDPAAALGELAGVHAAHDDLRMPLEQGRTFLLEGRLRRRLRQKRGARDAFGWAVEIFSAAGAESLAAVARSEMSRVGIRPPSPFDLTETERQVAHLAALGRTNRDVAQELFLSPRSVDGVLGRVYEKLGIHSRAELGSRLGPKGEDDARDPGISIDS